jgi:outer membrane protein insertion porin family
MRSTSSLLVVLLALAASVAARAEGGATAPPPPGSVGSPDAGAPEPGEPRSGPVVQEIKVEGNRRVEADAVRAAMVTKVGHVLEPAKATDDIKALFKLGYFSDVVIDAEPSAGGVTLTVKVTEKPAIKEVKISGNDELSNDDLKDLIDVKASSILDPDALRRNAKKIQDKYIEKGFYLAEVTPKVNPLPDNLVSVVFQIQEHAKVQVKAITFVGNERVSSEDLRSVMETQEGNVLSFITSSGTYREEVFQRDLSLVQFAYYDRGFINVRVGKPQVAITPDKRYLYLTIPITEGEQFNVGKIDFSGDILTTKEDLFKKLRTKTDTVFNRSQLQADIASLNDLYLDQGYAYVNISPLTSVDNERKIVDLTFDVQKGQKTYIERVEIVGNHKTRDRVIRRELRVYEGELFSGTGMKQSKARVTALGFFENVEVTQKKGSADDKVVVQVEVKEKATGTFQVGFGFSSVESFIFTATIQQNNFLGWGQTASVAAQVSSLRSLVQVSYLDPYFLDTNWIFSFDYYRIDADYYGFLRRSNGGDINFGYHLTPDLLLYLAYALEKVDVEPSSTTIPGLNNVYAVQFNSNILLANRFRSGWNSTVRLTLTYDKRDNRLFPTAGYYLSGTSEFGPKHLGGTFNFARYTGNGRVYVPLILGAVFKVNGNIGYIQPLQGAQLPISELYYVGGINSVRGYYLRTITPTVRVGSGGTPDSVLTPFPVGGDKQVTFNFELEFPIVEKIGIRGVLFYDAGNAFAADENFFQDKREQLPLSLFHSVGFGVRWFSPIGPLRFEWGIPLTKRPIDQSVDFEFTIGNFF